MDEQADGTYGKSDEGCLLVTLAFQHLTSRNTHEEVCGEVHHVTHHGCPGIFETPNITKWCSHVGYERNHCKDKTHGYDCNDTTVTISNFLFHCFELIVDIVNVL